ncbi:MAG: hypothetical protein KAW14_12560 [Candidatus Aegiribacteria sp.]|nr:hypothetical protein [Candidatus Aegiribacteria sp.]
MRPISIEQNSFRYPLNVILGTEAQIRLLRVMITEVNDPISIVDAAKRADLTPLGARKAMKRLTSVGIVKAIGGGRKQQYEISSNDVLVQAVAALFSAEADRFEHILASIRKCIEKVEPQLISAWIPSLPADPGYPIKICILQDARYLRVTIHNLQILFQEIEREVDMTIEIIGYSKADTPQQESGSLHLYGLPLSGDRKVETGIMTGPISHEKQDKRLADICRIIGRMINEDRSLIERAKKYTGRILKGISHSATGDIEEWRDILNKYSVRRLVQFLSSEEERSIRLRQSCPFFAVLNKKEKERVLEELGGER